MEEEIRVRFISKSGYRGCIERDSLGKCPFELIRHYRDILLPSEHIAESQHHGLAAVISVQEILFCALRPLFYVDFCFQIHIFYCLVTLFTNFSALIWEMTLSSSRLLGTEIFSVMS